jgi:hypothetical protein
MEIRIRLIYILQVMSPKNMHEKIRLFIYLWFIKLHGSNDRMVSGQLIEKDWEEVLIAKSAYEFGDGLDELKSTTKINQHNLCLS